MTTKPSNVDRLDDILSKFWAFASGADENGHTKAEAKAAIEQAVMEIIGPDEWNLLPKRKNYVGIRNELKAAQRKRLKAFIGSNHSGRESS